MIVAMMRMMRIYRFTDLQDLAEQKDAAVSSLREYPSVCGLETGIDFERNQISFLIDFETGADSRLFEHSRECIHLQRILGSPEYVHAYWRKDHA